MSSIKRKIQAMGACQGAVEWIGERETLAQIWADCERGDWLLWLCGKMADKPTWPTRKQVVFAACQCARTALPYTKDPRILACIETIEAWCRGDATIEQVKEARRSAYSAAYSAVAAATPADAASAYAAYAAADVACADGDVGDCAVGAAYGAAEADRNQSRKQMAEIVRALLTRGEL